MPSQRLSLSLPSALTGFLLLAAMSAQGQANPKPAGTISGKVTVNDKAAGEILVAAQPIDRQLPQSAARAKSDASGRYRLTGLAAGQYQIIAVAPALTVTELTGYQGSFYGVGSAVVLAAGEDADDVDIKLVQGGVITGRVTDADGKSVIEQQVNLQTIDQARNPTRQSSFGMWNYQMHQTDDRGVYRIYGLPAGRYRVSVGSNEGAFYMSRNRTYYPLTFYGNTGDAAKASVVELQEGAEATNIDIRVGRAASTFVASGRLVDAETGQPIPSIRLAYGNGRPSQRFHAGFVGAATNARGEFRLEGLQPGQYGVTTTSSESSAHYSDPLFFEIADADVTNLELKATRGLTLSGVVVFEGSRAKELQQHVASLRLSASVALPNQYQNSNSSSPIAGNGSFHLTGVPPGKARLYLVAMNPALQGITIVRAERGGVDVTQNLEIQPGESITDLRIVASLGAGTIRGTVRIIGGEVPPNIRLFVNIRREGSTTGGGGPVDARGRFIVGNLTGGSYEVILHVGYNSGTGQPIKPQKQTVTVSDGAETQVDFIVDLTQKEGAP